MVLDSPRSLSIFRFFISLLIVVWGNAPALAVHFQGISLITPIKVPRRDLPNSQPNKESVQNCYVLSHRVIVELDTGNKGVDAISIRPVKHTKNLSLACRAKRWKNEIWIPNHEQYFLGIVSDFLFTRSADVFGNLGTVWIYDLNTGKELFEAKYDHEHEFVASESERRVSLNYYHQLKSPCSLAESTKTCWSVIRKENQLPETFEALIPNCEEAISKMKPAPIVLQLFAKAKVNDLSRPSLYFLEAPVGCYPTP